MRRLLNGRVDLSRLQVARIKPLEGARGLPEPGSSKAVAIRNRLVDALQVRDESVALDLLLRCAWEVDPAHQVLTGWLPTLVALDELADQGQAIDADGRLRDFIANTLRAQIAHAVPCHQPLWVVPAQRDEAAAAWVLAVVSCQRGRPARPWLWASLPEAAFVTVGRRFDAARHNSPHCKGHYGLIANGSGGLGIAAMLGDPRSRDRARAIADRARRWRPEWNATVSTETDR